ncbi:MAG: bifunctional oligoribonuclease/PAP phosphatase NrnA [Synergistales bacterium]|nr:bifunctional oligoribonuclease/PAP phosphatase NrnA [Synergistales bacterium]
MSRHAPKQSDLASIIKTMETADTWLLISHEKPDGDTLGCAAALYEAAQMMGKGCRWIGKSPIPAVFSFIRHVDCYEQRSTLPSDFPGPEGCIIVVDTSTPDRAVAGIPEECGGRPLIVIDHHGDNAGYGTMDHVDKEAAATGEIIWSLFEKAGWGVSKSQAEALYVAIATDTGAFSFSNTTPRTHQVAAQLLQYGVLPEKIAQHLYSQDSLGKLRLWCRVLERVALWAGGRVAYMEVRQEDFEATQTTRDDIENLVNEAFRLRSVEFALLLTENSAETRASLRSRTELSARAIATEWGGGGHLQAAAFSTDTPIETVRSSLRDRIEMDYAERASLPQ